MEEKVVEGKEKKYVLYTVVGEERGGTTSGTWLVRVLLGSLVLMALAVVPYLSLRLAQNTDHPLVVYQPLPVPAHHRDHQHHARPPHPAIAQPAPLQSAALTLHNYTAVSGNGTLKSPAENGSSSGMVTLHEAAVTLAVLEDTNATRPDDHASTPSPDGAAQDNTTTEEEEDTSAAPASLPPSTATPHPATPPAATHNTTGAANTSASTRQGGTIASKQVTTPTPSPHPTSHSPPSKPLTTPAAKNASTNDSKVMTSTAAATAAAATTTTTTTTKAPLTSTPSAAPTATSSSSSSSSSAVPPAPSSTSTSSTHHPLAHKMVYMATTASGNHVGGFCVWKTDNHVTRWSYFYENIPIEYQSHQDTEDHEMRGLLAAVRTWAPLWHDHHVVLRSHYQKIKGSHHPTRRALTAVLEQLSDGHFTYELEWRLRKTDRVVDISYCLSRLHRDFDHWFKVFQNRVDELLDRQDWEVANKGHRAHIPQEAFDIPPVQDQHRPPGLQ